MRTAALTLLAALASPALCIAAGYDEATQGDLSNDRLAPTFVTIDALNNRITGSVTLGDRDYLTVQLPTNTVLQAIRLEQYLSNNARAFIGMQAGGIFNVAPSNAEPGDMLGYAHFGFDQLAGDLLQEMSTQFGAIGFATPLAAGRYTFWINQTEPSVTSYTLNFVMTTKGDANMDGHVDFDDLLILAQHYQQPGNQQWSTGDFNADATVDFDDLLLLTQNYQAGHAIQTQAADTLFQQWRLAQSMVPETTMLGTLAVLLPTRRRYASQDIQSAHVARTGT